MANHGMGNSDLNYADTLWKAADALRGQVDAAEYKHVVLGLLFLKYISDSFESRRDELRAELTKDGLLLRAQCAEDEKILNDFVQEGLVQFTIGDHAPTSRSWGEKAKRATLMLKCTVPMRPLGKKHGTGDARSDR